MKSDDCLEEGWYLLKTKPNRESLALENLENQGFDVYNPVIKVKKRHVLKEEVLFPGYLLVSLSLSDVQRYHKIRSTRGVSELVYFNRITRKLHQNGRVSKAMNSNLHELLPKPIPKGEDVIKTIKAIVTKLNAEAEGENSKKQRFSKGDEVLMEHSLYKNLKMTFQSSLGPQRGLILIEYIKTQRKSGELHEQVISKKKVNVALKDLQKAQ